MYGDNLEFIYSPFFGVWKALTTKTMHGRLLLLLLLQFAVTSVFGGQTSGMFFQLRTSRTWPVSASTSTVHATCSPSCLQRCMLTSGCEVASFREDDAADNCRLALSATPFETSPFDTITYYVIVSTGACRTRRNNPLKRKSHSKRRHFETWSLKQKYYDIGEGKPSPPGEGSFADYKKAYVDLSNLWKSYVDLSN